MVLSGTLPFFGSYVEAYAYLSTFHASFDELVSLIDELFELLDDLVSG
jgi:hypothetical protein